jgi:cytochrome P450
MTHSALPHPRFRVPVIGDLFFVDVPRTCQRLVKEIERHGGIVEQRIFDLSLVCISRTDLVNAVNDEAIWEKHVGPALQKLRPLTGDGLFTAYNDEPNWRKAHNIVMPAFTKAAMESYHLSMVATVRELADVWADRAATGAWTDIPADANRLTTEIISRVGLGYSFNKLGDTDTDPFIATMLRELDYANRRTRTDVIPFYEQLLGQARRQQHLRNNAYLREHIATIITTRRANNRNEGRDMLDIMLHAKDPETGQGLDDANIINQIATLLVAGTETSANTTAFALHYLSQNPHIAAAARAEIDQRWPDREFPYIAFADIAKLRYLRRVVDETLRLWPVAPGYFRQAKTDTAIGDGKYIFKAGDWVFVLLLAAHRDRASWGPDADTFNPDRFLSDNRHRLPAHTYKPFGTGPRACIGRQFAIHEILVTLAAVLHQYDLEPQPGYQLEVSETVSLKPAGLHLRLHRR